MTYAKVSDAQALDAFALLCETEGILPALESAHAVAFSAKLARKWPRSAWILVNLSGRGDKDLDEYLRAERDGAGAWESATRIADAFARARGRGARRVHRLSDGGGPLRRRHGRAGAGSGAGGTDVLELGVPFSDPIADGPVLQRAASRALEAGTTLETVFAIARRIRRETDMALVLFSYVNPILRYGAAPRRTPGPPGSTASC